VEPIKGGNLLLPTLWGGEERSDLELLFKAKGKEAALTMEKRGAGGQNDQKTALA